jgi:hypothetical protein
MLSTLMVNVVFWDVASCGLIVNRRFGGMLSPIFRVEEITRARKMMTVANTLLACQQLRGLVVLQFVRRHFFRPRCLFRRLLLPVLNSNRTVEFRVVIGYVQFILRPVDVRM